MAQALCDLQWAPPTRHAVLNEELTDIGLAPEEPQPTGLARQPRTIHNSDNLRAEVSREQDATSLADRFSRGGLPSTVGHLHGGITMEEESAYLDALQSSEDELDETRSNEAYPSHVIRQQDPCNAQGPCPSKPFEGLEQCLSWHQQKWDYLSHACPCHRRRYARFQTTEQPQSRMVAGYASHRGYPILKPPHTTNQAPTRVGDRAQDQFQHHGADRHLEDQYHVGWFTYMRDIAFPTSVWRSPYPAETDMRSGGTTSNSDRISAMPYGVMNTGRMEYDTRQGHSSGVPSTYLASRPLLGRDGQDSEGLMGSRRRTVTRGVDVNPLSHGTPDHGDSRRLASGLPANLSDQNPGNHPGFSPRIDHSGLGRQTDPGDRRTSNWRSSTPGNDGHFPIDGKTHVCITDTDRFLI